MDADIGVDDFIDLDLVDIAGNAVVETDTDSQEQITAGNGQISSIRAVHANHPQVPFIVIGNTALAHQRRYDRNLKLPDDGPQRLCHVR